MRATRLTTENHLRGRLPPCVTPALTYYQGGSQPRHTSHPRKGNRHDAGGKHPRFGIVGRMPVREYRPVHPFDYACRPRLRTRLTRGRRTWPRNPWSSSGRDSHPSLATHVCILTPTQSTMVHTTASPRAGRSPTQPPNDGCRVFGGVLEPRYIVGAEPLDQ